MAGVVQDISSRKRPYSYQKGQGKSGLVSPAGPFLGANLASKCLQGKKHSRLEEKTSFDGCLDPLVDQARQPCQEPE